MCTQVSELHDTIRLGHKVCCWAYQKGGWNTPGRTLTLTSAERHCAAAKAEAHSRGFGPLETILQTFLLKHTVVYTVLKYQRDRETDDGLGHIGKRFSSP